MLTIKLQIPEISLESQIELQFFFLEGVPFFRLERNGGHFLAICYIFSVSSLSARSCSVTLWIFEKPFIPLRNGCPNQFVLTNDKHSSTHKKTYRKNCRLVTQARNAYIVLDLLDCIHAPIIRAIFCIFTVHFYSYLSFLSHKWTISSPNVSRSISAQDS